MPNHSPRIVCKEYGWNHSDIIAVCPLGGRLLENRGGYELGCEMEAVQIEQERNKS